ncbi:hypothetical protein HK103_001124 [Boothiomyces macroporosus]|uniref:Uncharacterized protein n=1 Tax=Boothiomyces macroporosus TaxID=261099 RepID=A0AAD5UBJ3_9FUNG|nr:hypothetical protein HK103_001124 [Boothiomyces macroporosus]
MKLLVTAVLGLVSAQINDFGDSSEFDDGFDPYITDTSTNQGYQCQQLCASKWDCNFYSFRGGRRQNYCYLYNINYITFSPSTSFNADIGYRGGCSVKYDSSNWFWGSSNSGSISCPNNNPPPQPTQPAQKPPLGPGPAIPQIPSNPAPNPTAGPANPPAVQPTPLVKPPNALPTPGTPTAANAQGNAVQAKMPSASTTASPPNGTNPAGITVNSDNSNSNNSPLPPPATSSDSTTSSSSNLRMILGISALGVVVLVGAGFLFNRTYKKSDLEAPPAKPFPTLEFSRPPQTVPQKTLQEISHVGQVPVRLREEPVRARQLPLGSQASPDADSSQVTPETPIVQATEPAKEVVKPASMEELGTSTVLNPASMERTFVKTPTERITSSVKAASMERLCDSAVVKPTSMDRLVSSNVKSVSMDRLVSPKTAVKQHSVDTLSKKPSENVFNNGRFTAASTLGLNPTRQTSLSSVSSSKTQTTPIISQEKPDLS